MFEVRFKVSLPVLPNPTAGLLPLRCYTRLRRIPFEDSLRRLSWPLRKDDTNKSRSVSNCLYSASERNISGNCGFMIDEIVFSVGMVFRVILGPGWCTAYCTIADCIGHANTTSHVVPVFVLPCGLEQKSLKGLQAKACDQVQ
ncbi:unnamed protein product [Polarella glacialis]|uniref:Uncharacterized protein n=1 Tax=Polarella glacialis TaxID=89957 RepID=A0A813IV78_POLGL|nr:unnamed protein product [Polarella glacialis]